MKIVPVKASPKSGRRLLWLLLAGVLALSLAACTKSGTYPMDIFSEMHYQQSTRFQEPPRLLPGEGAVPRFGVAALRPERNDQTEARGQRLFEANCAMCHGLGALGDGGVAKRMVEAKVAAVPPPNLTTATTVNRSDEEIFGIISQGGALAPAAPQLTIMPVFQKLLSEEERWMILYHLRSLQGK